MVLKQANKIPMPSSKSPNIIRWVIFNQMKLPAFKKINAYNLKWQQTFLHMATVKAPKELRVCSNEHHALITAKHIELTLLRHMYWGLLHTKHKWQWKQKQVSLCDLHVLIQLPMNTTISTWSAQGIPSSSFLWMNSLHFLVLELSWSCCKIRKDSRLHSVKL